ncbi:MAG: 1-deoxy-D-xylulose-5-phosphate synthase N-terminal domain-containing protein, partial [Candidatus Cryptobacteroides sp.]|nr:1-deoxy-D-xylulose-5-phosphate synthase N-terminal domain-containing protein [Candidatus Cryptobacteroides sp.]
MSKYLDKIDSPEDLRRLDEGQLQELCGEIREYMIGCCATNPGHIGSSLGAVELIVGIHKVFNTPDDKVVFDVSHQSYAHKILTGRREAFRNKRRLGGISGFTRIDESPYDAFGAGHSSTSISAALGLARAAKMQGRDEKVIALIGDGALTGGLAYEGLNNAGGSDTDLLVILNDNNISIDRNTGSMHEYLLRITTHPKYNKLKDRVWNRMGDSRIRRSIQRMVVRMKSNIVSSSGGDLFEAMGFRYFGPIDGNDIAQVTETLERLKGIRGPKILHAITTKGKGFAPAEEDQTTWHAPGMFDPHSGERIKGGNAGISRYQDVFGEVLLTLSRKDPRVVGVTPAMASGCGMNLLAREMPERF